MTKETSIYLDAIRFLAACFVVIYHSSGIHVTGGFLWEVSGYGPSSVMIFFVLSGYVIGFVVDKKEKTLSDYLISRVSRLYSVIIPAIILTIICNKLGSYTLSEHYLGPWNEAGAEYYLRYIASFFMLQDVWSVNMSPSNNGSFWSLSYEFFYYLLFASIFFFQGKQRIILAVCVVLIAGPKIISIAPIWGLGYLAYKQSTTQKLTLSPSLSILLFTVSLLILALSPIHRDLLKMDDVTYLRSSMISDYIDGCAFFIHLISMPYVLKKASWILMSIRPVVTWLASLTFSIYLFHLPLIRLTAGSSPFIDDVSSAQHIIFVFGITSFVIIFLGIPAEYSKKLIKKWLYRINSSQRCSNLDKDNI